MDHRINPDPPTSSKLNLVEHTQHNSTYTMQTIPIFLYNSSTIWEMRWIFLKSIYFRSLVFLFIRNPWVIMKWQMSWRGITISYIRLTQIDSLHDRKESLTFFFFFGNCHNHFFLILAMKYKFDYYNTPWDCYLTCIFFADSSVFALSEISQW